MINGIKARVQNQIVNSISGRSALTMTSNLVTFIIITFATVTWIRPIFNQELKPSLHKKHNDDIYAESVTFQSTEQYLGNKKVLFRRFNGEPDKDTSSNSELKSINQPCESIYIKTIKDILVLLKKVLLEGSKIAKTLSENILIKDNEKDSNTKKPNRSHSTEVSNEKENDEELE